MIPIENKLSISGKTIKNSNTIKNINTKLSIILINGISINLDILPIYINTIEDLLEYIKYDIKYEKYKNLQFPYNNYYILHNNKIIPKTTKIRTKEKNTYILGSQSYEVIERLNGGGFVDMLMGIIKIGDLFAKIGEFIIWLLKFVYWFVMFLVWVITDLLNPLKLSQDFFKSLLLLVVSICKIPFDILLGLFQLSVNTLGTWMQGFWGWDQSSLTKKDRNSKYFNSFNRTKNRKCYMTNTNTVPFSVIIGTIVCPPMGVFMDMGITGWLNIIICCLLTLVFYVPGLVYALLIIYS